MAEGRKPAQAAPWIGIVLALTAAVTAHLESRSGRQELMTRGMAAEREFIISTAELHQVTQGVLDKCILRDEVLKVRIDYLEKSLTRQAVTMDKVEKTAKKAKKVAKREVKRPALVPVPEPPPADRLNFRQHQSAYGP